jgi:hypothetical protein
VVCGDGKCCSGKCLDGFCCPNDRVCLGPKGVPHCISEEGTCCQFQFHPAFGGSHACRTAITYCCGFQCCGNGELCCQDVGNQEIGNTVCLVGAGSCEEAGFIPYPKG